MKGECYLTNYADDSIYCFQNKHEAELFLNKLLPERLGKFNLTLAKDKTKLLLFGRYAKERSKGKRLETFDFLGFTHYCGLSKNGKFRVKRKTAKKKFNEKVKEMKKWIIDHRCMKVKEIIKQINIKLRGHYQYYGVTDNIHSITAFARITKWLLWKWLNRRSERKSYTLEEFTEMIKQNPLIKPKIYVNICKV